METKKYTIEDLREGKVAVVNDGTVEELRNVIKKAFPKDTFEALASHKYYYKKNNNGEEWWSHNDNKLRLPTQSVKVFLKEIAIEEVKEKAKKGVNIVMETKELNIIPISMRCTQEQYKSIKPILDANGISNDFVFSYADTFLVTNYSDDIVVMNTLSIDAEKFGRTLFTEWDEKIFLKCLGIETKELKVGDYIRGFKYDCSKGLEELMDSHVGEIGIIVEKHKNLIKVKFQDNSTWNYSHHLAIEHLVDPLQDTPFHKPDFSHLRDFDKVLEKGIKNSGLNEIPIEELEAHFKEEQKLYSILLSKDKDRRIVIDQTKGEIDLLVDASKGWHVIVIEQQQDKGIQIVIKS